MNEHDVIEARTCDTGTVIYCRCGLVFDPPQAREEHAKHHDMEQVREVGIAGVAAARAALEAARKGEKP